LKPTAIVIGAKSQKFATIMQNAIIEIQFVQRISPHPSKIEPAVEAIVDNKLTTSVTDLHTKFAFFQR
jgi:hypothetical protein